MTINLQKPTLYAPFEYAYIYHASPHISFSGITSSSFVATVRPTSLTLCSLSALLVRCGVTGVTGVNGI